MTGQAPQDELNRSVPHSPLAPRRSTLLRSIRKNRYALLAIFVFNFVLFFPTLFLERWISPNDIYSNYDPWRTLRPMHVQNPLMNDPATSYITLVSLLQTDPASFHWNRFIASGIPGFGSVASAILSPFALLPGLLLPLFAFYSGMVALKLNVAFILAYNWLREERLGRRGAAIGASAFAGAGIYIVWWLWQGTNATALYPGLLWAIARASNGKRNRWVPLVLLFTGFALSGFPATVVYIGYVGVAYALVRAVRAIRSKRHLALKTLAIEGLKLGSAATVALVATSPFLVPFLSFLSRTGYLEARREASVVSFYPVRHLLGLIFPYRLGDPVSHSWRGDPLLGISNNFVEATLYSGVFVIALSFLVLVPRKRVRAGFWIVLLGMVTILMISGEAWGRGVSWLPGLRYTPLTRFRMILPIAFAFLAAAGSGPLFALLARRFGPSFRRRCATFLVMLVAGDLALFAARFHPYLTIDDAALPESELVSYLKAQRGIFRISPQFDALWPNAAELLRIEDIRSHFGSEAKYRQIMKRIDPESFGSSGTVIQFNSLRMNIDDPFLSFLGVRYFVEQPSIALLRWSTKIAEGPVEPHAGLIRISPGGKYRRLVHLGPETTHGIIVHVRPDGPAAVSGGVRLSLIRPETGARLFSTFFKMTELAAEERVEMPVSPYAGPGNALLLEIESRGTRATVDRTAPIKGEDAIRIDRVRSPLFYARSFRDGRLFLNATASERYFAVWELREMTFPQLIEDRTVDLRRVAVVEKLDPALASALRDVDPYKRQVRIRPLRYDGTRSSFEVDSAVPFFLATSEKYSPELEIRVDGTVRELVGINGLFAGLPMPSGRHRVEIERRIGRGFWLPAAAAVIVLFLAGLFPLLNRSAPAPAPGL